MQSTLQQDPFSGTVFMFGSKRADRVTLRMHDGTGLVLIWKRLEGGRSKWPVPGLDPGISEGVVAITAAQLAYMLDHAS